MKVVERLGAVAVDGEDQRVFLPLSNELGADFDSSRPREDIRIVKSRVVEL